MPEPRATTTQISSFCSLCGTRRHVACNTLAELFSRLLELDVPFEGRCSVCNTLWTLSSQERLAIAEVLVFTEPGATDLPERQAPLD